jgi:SlyX protein
VATGTELESRLADIEVKLSFSEDLLDELNRTVVRQQQQIERLQQEVRALREHLIANQPADPRTPPDETPPHY